MNYLAAAICIISVHVLGNAILNAKTPVMDELAQRKGQYVTLDASGLAVGLPAGLMGNSEVGHFTIGTGRVTFQVSIYICGRLYCSNELRIGYCGHQ